MSCPFCQNQDCYAFFHDFFCANCNAPLQEQDALNMNLVCVRCHQATSDNTYSDAGRFEIYLSGLCERCFDIITEEPEEGDEEEMQLLKFCKGEENPEGGAF